MVCHRRLISEGLFHDKKRPKWTPKNIQWTVSDMQNCDQKPEWGYRRRERRCWLTPRVLVRLCILQNSLQDNRRIFFYWPIRKVVPLEITSVVVPEVSASFKAASSESPNMYSADDKAAWQRCLNQFNPVTPTIPARWTSRKLWDVGAPGDFDYSGVCLGSFL